MMQSEDLLGRGDVGRKQAFRGIEEPGPGPYGLTARYGIPAEPLFGVLPIRRVVPQNVHSLLDYSNGIVVALAGLNASKREAKIACAVLGATVIGVSLLTDYRLSLAKVIPIEVHEVLDHVWSASVIAAPFVFGYSKRAPVATIVQVLTGVTTIVGSLFTDYRAVRGVGRRAVQRAMEAAGTESGEDRSLQSELGG